MELITIISIVFNFIFGGTTLWGIIVAIRYRKENKEIKKAEATTANVESQKQEIILANLYKDEMLKMVEQMKNLSMTTIEQIRTANSKSENNQEQILARLANLDSRMDSMEARMGNLDNRMGNVESFLNGEYRNWVAKHTEEKPKRTIRRKTKKDEPEQEQ